MFKQEYPPRYSDSDFCDPDGYPCPDTVAVLVTPENWDPDRYVWERTGKVVDVTNRVDPQKVLAGFDKMFQLQYEHIIMWTIDACANSNNRKHSLEIKFQCDDCDKGECDITKGFDMAPCSHPMGEPDGEYNRSVLSHNRELRVLEDAENARSIF